MPTTSPYQNNDYNAVSSFRPFNLPVNSILKGLKAQNEYWDEGARMVKQYYDNALDMNLTLTENQEIRKKFMADADKQLAKLSTMNLADPSVQRQGFGIYKPLFEDEGILLDDAITKKYGSIISEAQRYKRDQKTKGEGYHTDNLQYALQDFAGFGSGTSRSQLKDIYGKVKNAEYTPYHDVSKEYMELASKCKPNKMSANSVQGMYFHESTDNSLDASKLNGCIKAGLSDKGWQQLRITGSVRLGKDYKTIGNSYADIIRGNNQAAASQLTTLAAERKKLEAVGQFTDEVKKAYEEQEDGIRKGIIQNNSTLGKISVGDYSDIEKNYDNIVSQVWANQDIGSFAQAFSYKDTTDKWSANAAGIAQMRENGENARFSTTMQWNQMKFGAELQMKAQENQIKLLDALMGGLGGGKGSGGKGGGMLGMGMNYQLFNQFVKPIMQGLGIENPDQIESFLDDGTYIPQGAQETAETINDKANRFHHERLETAQGMYNVLKDLLPAEVIKELERDGHMNSEAIYNAADQYLSDYHKAPAGKNSAYANKLDQIQQLEAMTNEYSNATSNVHQFMKMRDDINSAVSKNPKLKAKMDEINASITKEVNANFGNKKAFVIDNGSMVVFDKNDITRMAQGTHSTYRMKGQKIYNIRTGQEVSSKLDAGSQLAGEAIRNGYVGLDITNTWGINRLVTKREEEVTPLVTGIVSGVVRNSTIHGVGNTPGLAVTMKQKLSAAVPTYNSDEYRVIPGVAFKDASGQTLTTVQVQRKREKTADKDDDDDTQDSWINVDSEDVLKELQNNKYSVGGSNDINVMDGKVVVKTPYLPVAKDAYALEQTVNNMVYAANKMNLGYQQKHSQVVKRIQGTGGFKIGFDAVGTGSSYEGQTNPKMFRTWYMTPSGEKEYVGDPVYAENQVSNQLKLVEQQMGQISNGYHNKKK